MDNCVVNDVFYQCQSCSSYFTSISSCSRHSSGQCRHLRNSGDGTTLDRRILSFQLVSFPPVKVRVRKLNRREEDNAPPPPTSTKTKRLEVSSEATITLPRYPPNVPIKLEPTPRGRSSSPVTFELEQVHFEDRIVIRGDGTAVHCNGERLDSYSRGDSSKFENSRLSISSNSGDSKYETLDDPEAESYRNSDHTNDKHLLPDINLDRDYRTRQQNKGAAKRYRRNTLLKLMAIEEQESYLQTKNKNLSQDKHQVERELRFTRGLVLDKIQERKRRAFQLKIDNPNPSGEDDASLDSNLLSAAFESNAAPNKSREAKGRPRKCYKALVEDKKERKKLQNIEAARRYRMRKNEKLGSIVDNFKDHLKTREELKKKKDHLQFQLNVTRKLLLARLQKLKENNGPTLQAPSTRTSICVKKEVLNSEK